MPYRLGDRPACQTALPGTRRPTFQHTIYTPSGRITSSYKCTVAHISKYWSSARRYAQTITSSDSFCKLQASPGYVEKAHLASNETPFYPNIFITDKGRRSPGVTIARERHAPARMCASQTLIISRALAQACASLHSALVIPDEDKT